MYRRRGFKRRSTFARRNRRTGGFIGIDFKHIDKHASHDVITADINSAIMVDPADDNLNSVVEGSSEIQRIGKQQYLKRCSVKGFVGAGMEFADTTQQNGRIYDIWMVLDKQANEATMTPFQFLEVAPGAVGSNAGLLFRNWEFKSRFQVLDHVKINTGAEMSSTSSSANTYLEDQIPFTLNKTWNNYPLKINYSKATGAMNAIVDNAIHIVVAISSKFGVEYLGKSEITYNSRCIFTG